MKWFKRLFCKHLYISDKPVMNPNTWDMELKCGKCGYVQRNRF